MAKNQQVTSNHSNHLLVLGLFSIFNVFLGCGIKPIRPGENQTTPQQKIKKVEASEVSKSPSEKPVLSIPIINSNSGKQTINLNVTKKVLPNGLTILVSENPHLPIYSMKIYYKIGSKFEDAGLTGATHFLEHMMFKGAKKYGPGVFDKFVEGNGGKTNAYTSQDLTVYYQNLPSHTLEKMMDIEADRMANLLLAPESFEKERAVILEERKYRYENSAQGQLFQKMIEEVYVDTPYGVPTIGTIEDIKSVTRDQMMDYFKTFYAPNAAILVVVGDVNANEVLKLAEEKMGQLPRSKVYDQVVEKKDAPYLFHHRAEYGRHVKVQGESPDPIFALAFKGEPMGSQKSYVLDMLASLLGAGKSSYLTQEFVFHEKPQATSIYAYNYNLKNNGIFMIGGQLMPKINIDRFESDLKKKLIQSCEVAMTERSLQKSKNQFILSYFNQLESNAGLASFIGDREAYLNDFMSYQKEIEIYQKMDSKILIQTCREIFSEKALMISVWEKYPKEKKK